MLSMRVERVVEGIVRQELVGKGREHEALHFHFDLSLSIYGTTIDTLRQRRGLHLLYYLPPERSYISVFSHVTDNPFEKVQYLKGWTHETTHDDCWANIQTFSQVYFDMARKINDKLVASGGNEIAPMHMSECNGFAIFGSTWQWLKAKVEKDPKDSMSYRKTIQLL